MPDHRRTRLGFALMLSVAAVATPAVALSAHASEPIPTCESVALRSEPVVGWGRLIGPESGEQVSSVFAVDLAAPELAGIDIGGFNSNIDMVIARDGAAYLLTVPTEQEPARPAALKATCSYRAPAPQAPELGDFPDMPGYVHYRRARAGSDDLVLYKSRDGSRSILVVVAGRNVETPITLAALDYVPDLLSVRGSLHMPFHSINLLTKAPGAASLRWQRLGWFSGRYTPQGIQ